MTHDHPRRRLSLALPAFVFLFFTLAETVEVRAVTETLLSLGSAEEEPVRVEPARRVDARDVKTCKPIRKGVSEA